MRKKPVKSTRQSALPLSEKQAYEEKILRLKAQLFQTEVERYVKYPTRFAKLLKKPIGLIINSTIVIISVYKGQLFNFNFLITAY